MPKPKENRRLIQYWLYQNGQPLFHFPTPRARTAYLKLLRGKKMRYSVKDVFKFRLAK